LLNELFLVHHKELKLFKKKKESQFKTFSAPAPLHHILLHFVELDFYCFTMVKLYIKLGLIGLILVVWETNISCPRVISESTNHLVRLFKIIWKLFSFIMLVGLGFLIIPRSFLRYPTFWNQLLIERYQTYAMAGFLLSSWQKVLF